MGGVMWALAYGIPLVIAPKFSASMFWDDIHHYNVTVCFYMGELCRFLLNHNKALRSHPKTGNYLITHPPITMVGSGVNPEVCRDFKNTFNVKKFVEFYASTEGNCSLVNIEGTKVGPVGYIPLLLQPLRTLAILKVEETSGEILRDTETGFCINCNPNEPGEMVGKIHDFIPSLRYDGYTNGEANKKKILHNVFRKGDKYFRSGDIMMKDEEGYVYFKDRIGDTFRWKGENVSTAEVEGLILRLTNMRTTVVYGIKIPGTEGRAGMATIVDPEGTLDVTELGKRLKEGLPSYARPVFIRVIIMKGDEAVEMTGTFKLTKLSLRREGFNIKEITDPIFIYSSIGQRYEKLDTETYQLIMREAFRF